MSAILAACAPKAARDELSRETDDCYKWAKAQADLFLEESTSVQLVVSELMATHHNAAKPHKGINGANPFVIAMAQDGGSHWIVVSDEHSGSLDNRKIPFACNHEKAPCISFQGLMLAEGWRFR